MTAPFSSEQLAAAVTSDALGHFLAESAGRDSANRPGPTRSVRTAEHDGHRISVATTFEVTVDGRPVVARLHVADNGTIHTSALPYRHFTSALDAVRALVSARPDSFEGGT